MSCQVETPQGCWGYMCNDCQEESNAKDEWLDALRLALAAAEKERDEAKEACRDEAWKGRNLQRVLEDERDANERGYNEEPGKLRDALALAERQAAEAELALTRGAMDADDRRLSAAAVRVWGENLHGCDTPDAMADLIETLRLRIADLEAELARLRESTHALRRVG